jgi:hypothetical protein
MVSRSLLACVLVLLAVNDLSAQSLARADSYRVNGLIDYAKKDLIDLANSGTATPQVKAEALSNLAEIAFDEKNYRAAAASWRKLIDSYPKTPQAEVAKGGMALLAEVAGALDGDLSTEIVGRAYLRNGDFFSDGRQETVGIDTSWLPNVDLAVRWYDRVISEFAGSPIARTAYEHKLQTLLGWEEPGQYGRRFGLRSSPPDYLPILESTFRDFEKAFPDAPSLQAFRYVVAQAFWSWSKTDGKAKPLFEEIISRDPQGETFFGRLAMDRLAHWSPTK